MRGDRAAVDEAAAVLHRVEQDSGMGVAMASSVGCSIPLCDAEIPDDVVTAFLDGTSLVVDGETMQMRFVVLDRQHRERDFTYRDWGHHMAAWANRTFPEPGRARAPRQPSPCSCDQCYAARHGEWLYIDFSMGTDFERIFAGYARWLDHVEVIVRRKTERFGLPFGVQPGR